MKNVTGVIRTTVVTLSRNALATAVMSEMSTRRRYGRPSCAPHRLDREPLEDAGLPQDVRDDHHSREQEDDVEVDDFLRERLVLVDEPESDDDDAPSSAASVRWMRSVTMSA